MAQEQSYGGFWVRVVALTLDNAIVFMLLLAMGLAMAVVVTTVGMEGVVGALASLAGTLVPFLYWPVLESSGWQATVGKRIMGLQVTDAEGGRLSFLHALMRMLAKIVSTIPFGLGFVMAAFTARKQALHDLIVKTLVVRSGPSHLWKIILALLVGIVLMVASAVGLFYYVAMPMFKKMFSAPAMEAKVEAPGRKTIPAPAPAGRAPQAQPQQPAQPAAPAPQVAATAGKEGPDADFDAVAGKPLAGLDKPNSTRAGPAILELSTVFPTSVWVKVYTPVPALGDVSMMPSPRIVVTQVFDSGGKDYYDAGSTFETNEFFLRPSLSQSSAPVPHLAGTRSVNLRSGLSEQALHRVEGQVIFSVPVNPISTTFDAKDAGKPMSLHGASVSLVSLNGNAARLHYRGASEHLLLVRGYGADGKMLAVDSRQILPAKQDVDQDFTITFKGPVAKVEFEVAARIIERVFPFSLARGGAAGPAPAASSGITLPPRTTQAAAPAPSPAAQPAASAPTASTTSTAPTPAPVVAPAPVPTPVAVPPMKKPAEVAARPAPKPRAESRAPSTPPATARPLGQAQSQCVFKPVMTDEDIARCR
jgi:uncharacterized RDD family membrane protein YckC